MNRFPFLFIYGTECNVITLQFLLQMETKELFPIPQRYIPALIWLKGVKQRDIVTVSGITKLVLKRTREEMGQVHISGEPGKIALAKKIIEMAKKHHHAATKYKKLTKKNTENNESAKLDVTMFTTVTI